MKYFFKRSKALIVGVLSMLLSFHAYSQGFTLSGSQTTYLGELTTYTIQGGGSLTVNNATWQALNGSVQSGSNTSTADVIWDNSGSAQVSVSILASDFNYYTVSLAVNVAGSPPLTPNTTPIATNGNCGSVTILRNDAPPPGVEWFWQTDPNGTLTSQSGASLTLTTPITPPGSYTYYLRALETASGLWSINSSPGVSFTLSANLDIPPAPVVDEFCGGVNLTMPNAPLGVAYFWQNSPTGTLVTGVADDQVLNLNSGNVYYLRARDGITGCWSDARTVNYNIITSAETPPMPTIVNGCGVTTLTREAPPAGYTYYWQTSHGATSTANSDMSVQLSSGNVYYLRSQNNSTLCWSHPVIINYNTQSGPEAPPVPTVDENCGSTLLTRAEPPTGITWYWQDKNSTGTDETNSALTYLVRNPGTHYLRAKEDNGCWGASVAVSATVRNPPNRADVPIATRDTNTGIVTLTRGTPPAGVTWYWQGTNQHGTSESDASLTYEVIAPGTYYLRAKSDNGCWRESTGILVINASCPGPVIPPMPTVSYACGVATLSRISPPSGETWYWQGTNIDGQLTNDAAATYSATSPGTYYLRSRSDQGCWSESVGAVVIDSDTPAMPTVLENCGSTLLTRAEPPAGITWYWQDKNSAGTDETNSAQTFLARNPGTYYLRAKEDNGCWGSSISVSVTVKSVPNRADVPTKATDPITGIVTLTRGTPPSGVTWYWQGTDQHGTLESDDNLTYEVIASGTYYLRAKSDNGCWRESTPIIVTEVNCGDAPSTPQVDYDCGNATLYTTTAPPPGFSWYWQGTDPMGISLANSSDNMIVTTSGTYYLRTRSDNGCWGPSTGLSIVVESTSVPTPSATILSEDCGATTLTHALPPAGQTWYWQGTNPDGIDVSYSQPEYTTGAAGTYYLRARNDQGCWSESFAIVVSVKLIPKPPVAPAITPGNGQVTLTRSYPPGGQTWYWQGTDANGTSTANAQLDYVATASGTYYIRSLMSNGCWSAPRGVIVTIPECDIAPGTENYVMSTRLLTGTTDESQIAGFNADQRDINIQYVDGLGRPLQTVAVEASPAKKHMVQAFEYDQYGREVKKYLPYVTDNCTVFQSDPLGLIADSYTGSDQYQFYQNTPDIAHDIAPYALAALESSPLNRLLKQGAPGIAWQPVVGSFTDHVVHAAYESNMNYEVRFFEIESDQPKAESASGYYNAGDLLSQVTVDEDGNEVVQFTNKKGQVVLKQVGTGDVDHPWAKTYYVYDDYGNLRVVLPPELSKTLDDELIAIVPEGFQLVTQNLVVTAANHVPGTSYMYMPGATVTLAPGFSLPPGERIKAYVGEVSTDLLDTWAFQYKYDGRNRMVEKRVPGAEWVYMVYDQLDRLVLSQDANQRANDQWTFTKYDVFSRPVLTGFYTNASDRNTVQTLANGETDMFEIVDTIVLGYTNDAFPSVPTASDYLTATYYDDYSNLPTGFGLAYVQELGNTANNTAVTGQVVGSKTKVLDGSGTWLKSAVYYDNRYRLIQSVGTNQLGGQDRTTSQYDFSGRQLQTKITHGDGTDITTLNEYYSYDHASRLMQVSHQVNSDPAVILVDNEYNELGELIDKKLHSADLGLSFEQSVDYRYNIRGWLTNINDVTLNDGEDDYFGMQLLYENTGAIGNVPAYNGNISGANWSNYQAGNNQRDAYNYSYDAMNRLTAADYHQRVASASWVDKTDFDLPGISYDLNGNILNLTRHHVGSTPMDNLAYSYAGNQLLAVTDTGDALEGFKDGNTLGNDYTYDANGNMISDANKDITSIAYNHLNLPATVTFTGGRSIAYTYDAAGMKLRKSADDNGSLKATDYVGGFIYEDNVLQQIGHAEGRVRRKHNGGFVYDYYLKDHLGNTRITFTTESEEVVYLATMETDVTSETDYQVYEESLFLNLPATRTNTPSIANKSGELGITNDETARLRGNDPLRQIGPAKLMQVSRGDVVDLEAYAYYTGTYTDNGSINSGAFITSIIGAVTGAAPVGAETSGISGGINGNSAIVFVGDDATNTQPRAYLNYILFDSDFNYLDAGFDQVSNVAEDGHEKLTLPSLNIEKRGYLYVYVSNESNTGFDVFFDNLRITHTKGKVLQEDHYYPFGANISALSSTAPLSTPNKYKYNGNEEQTEFDFGLYDFNARFYDPVLGRFTNVDPLADNPKQLHLSPYQFSWNNPINLNDPSGECPLGINCNAIESWFQNNVVTPVREAVSDAKQTARDFGNTLVKASESSWDGTSFFMAALWQSNGIILQGDGQWGDVDDDHLPSKDDTENVKYVDFDETINPTLEVLTIGSMNPEGPKAGQFKNNGTRITFNGMAKGKAKGQWKSVATDKKAQDSLVNFLRTYQNSDGSFYQKLLKISSYHSRIYNDTVYHVKDGKYTHPRNSDTNSNDNNKNEQQ